MRVRMAALVVALLVALGGCAATPAGGGASGSFSVSAEAARFFAATWRASVDDVDSAVYGDASRWEYLFELRLHDDGSAELRAAEGHEDLLEALGSGASWEAADAQSATLHLATGEDVTLSVVDDITMEAPAAPFGVEGFETLVFRYY